MLYDGSIIRSFCCQDLQKEDTEETGARCCWTEMRLNLSDKTLGYFVLSFLIQMSTLNSECYVQKLIACSKHFFYNYSYLTKIYNFNIAHVEFHSPLINGQ